MWQTKKVGEFLLGSHPATREAGLRECYLRLGDQLVREALDLLGADAPDDDTILEFARSALELEIAFVNERAIVSTFDDPFEVIPMPEVDRGVGVAYCDPPGPLETAEIPTFIAST